MRIDTVGRQVVRVEITAYRCARVVKPKSAEKDRIRAISKENQNNRVPEYGRNVYRQLKEGMYVGRPKGMVKNVGMQSKTHDKA